MEEQEKKELWEWSISAAIEQKLPTFPLGGRVLTPADVEALLALPVAMPASAVSHRYLLSHATPRHEPLLLLELTYARGVVTYCVELHEGTMLPVHVMSGWIR